MVNSLTTNEQGTCTITGIEAGSLTINVSKEGYVSASETINVTKDETVDITLTLAQQEEEEPTGSVHFTIQDSESQGIANARITLTDSVTNTEYQNGNGGTGSSGGSTISDLPYGTYSVLVTCTGYEDATDEVTIDSETQVEKTIILTSSAPSG